MKKTDLTTIKIPAFLIKISVIFIVLLNPFCSCGRNSESKSPGTGEKPIPAGAKRFILEQMHGYSQLSILDPWQGARNVSQVWFLVPEGEKPPEGIDTLKVIYVPVKKIVCMSTTHAAMISALNENKSIYGFSGTGYLFDQDLKDLVSQGSIQEIGYEDNLDKEKIIKISPDLIMIYGIGSESSSYIAKFKELGIRTMFNADYLETDPLGKAEWIRVFGALYCKQEMADSLYGEIQKKYLDLKTFIEHNIKNHPKVLLGLPFRDTWFISPGNSYISELINDAGGDYLWSSTQSPVSMPVGIEAVFLKAMEADYWLNTGSATTPEEIISIDSRLAGLPCFSDGNLYNNIKRVSTDGGNDYWEGGCLFPDIILRDIASILHPDLFPGNDLYYYQKLE
jgi:iron complex transport system substrate-binding protein